VAHPQIAVFARLAEGNQKPLRKVEGQNTMLARTMHGIAYHRLRDEFFVPQPFAQSILAFRGAIAGDEAPARYIQGSRTLLNNPTRIDVDPIHDEIFIPEGERMLVFSATANGNAAPIRIMKMPPGVRVNAVAVDYVNNIVIAGNESGSPAERYPRLLFLDRTASGDVTPLRAVGGPKTMITAIFSLRAHSEKGLVLLAMQTPVESGPRDEVFVGVWSNLHDDGDVPPRWTIGGPYGVLKQPRGIDLDTRNKSVIITDKVLNSVLTFYFPEIF